MPDLTLRECPFCDKVVSGVPALIAHMKHCKRQRCDKCDQKASCQRRDYFIECEKAKQLNP